MTPAKSVEHAETGPLETSLHGRGVPDAEYDLQRVFKEYPEIRQWVVSIESRLDEMDERLARIAAEGIRAQIESADLPDLVGRELTERVLNLESVYNEWEGDRKPDLLMRLVDIERRLSQLGG